MKQLQLIKGSENSENIIHRIARVIYAETGASSLLVVEALSSMISNLVTRTKKRLEDLMKDESLFESLKKNSVRHALLHDRTDTRAFRMCLRTVYRMMTGSLPDMCCGATRFHHIEDLPDWAVSRGYIAEIDGLLFYL